MDTDASPPRCSTSTAVASMQNRYNHEDRSAEKLLDTCGDHGIAFFAWAPVQVTDDTAVATVAERHAVSTSTVALAWLLARSPVMVPITGHVVGRPPGGERRRRRSRTEPRRHHRPEWCDLI
jgi:aryl-alcohol dehydrogenase-like predicted oxidoreductase